PDDFEVDAGVRRETIADCAAESDVGVAFAEDAGKGPRNSRAVIFLSCHRQQHDHQHQPHSTDHVERLHGRAVRARAMPTRTGVNAWKSDDERAAVLYAARGFLLERTAVTDSS